MHIKSSLAWCLKGIIRLKQITFKVDKSMNGILNCSVLTISNKDKDADFNKSTFFYISVLL